MPCRQRRALTASKYVVASCCSRPLQAATWVVPDHASSSGLISSSHLPAPCSSLARHSCPPLSLPLSLLLSLSPPLSLSPAMALSRLLSPSLSLSLLLSRRRCLSLDLDLDLDRPPMGPGRCKLWRLWLCCCSLCTAAAFVCLVGRRSQQRILPLHAKHAWMWVWWANTACAVCACCWLHGSSALTFGLTVTRVLLRVSPCAQITALHAIEATRPWARPRRQFHTAFLEKPTPFHETNGCKTKPE